MFSWPGIYDTKSALKRKKIYATIDLVLIPHPPTSVAMMGVQATFARVLSQFFPLSSEATKEHMPTFIAGSSSHTGNDPVAQTLEYVHVASHAKTPLNLSPLPATALECSQLDISASRFLQYDFNGSSHIDRIGEDPLPNNPDEVCIKTHTVNIPLTA